MVAGAWGEVAHAEGHNTESITSMRHALEIWQEIGSPMNVASVRLRLAQFLVAEGDTEGADLELYAAESVFRKLGATALLLSCEEMRRSVGQGPA